MCIKGFMKCDESKLKKTVLIETDRELAKLCKALGNKNYDSQSFKRNSCVCGEIVDELPISQSTISTS